MGFAPVSPLLKMKFVSAYAMCVLGGTESPGVGDVKKVLESVGYEWQEEDSKKVEDFVEEMAGQNFYELIENGLEKVKSCAGRGGGWIRRRCCLIRRRCPSSRGEEEGI